MNPAQASAAQTLSGQIDYLTEKLSQLNCHEKEKVGLEQGRSGGELVAGCEQSCCPWLYGQLGYRTCVARHEQATLLGLIDTVQGQLYSLSEHHGLRQRRVELIDSPAGLTKEKLQSFLDSANTMMRTFVCHRLERAFTDAWDNRPDYEAVSSDKECISQMAAIVHGVIKELPDDLVRKVLSEVTSSVKAKNSGNPYITGTCEEVERACTGKISSQQARHATSTVRHRSQASSAGGKVQSYKEYMKYGYNQFKSAPHVAFYEKGKPFYEFTNFYVPSSGIDIDGVNWPTTEHYFQASKFPEGSREWLYVLYNCPGPMDAFKYPKTVPLYRWRVSLSTWDNVEKDKVMMRALRAKAKQDKVFRDSLLNKTGNKPIFENSPRDSYWGVGADGTGQNALGALLMQLRDELRAGRELPL